MKDQGFETKSVRMERLLTVSVFAPEEDADRIMAHVSEIVPLTQGEKYDPTPISRPLAWSATGPR